MLFQQDATGEKRLLGGSAEVGWWLGPSGVIRLGPASVSVWERAETMVIGDAGNTTCTISVDYTGPTSGTISATIPGTIEAPPGTVVLHQFTLHNTSGSMTTRINGERGGSGQG